MRDIAVHLSGTFHSFCPSCKRAVPILLILMGNSPATALPERQFDEVLVQKLYPSLKKWSQSVFFKGYEGVKLHYRIYGKNQKSSRVLVIIPGWAEFSLKYMELAHDLMKQSYSPIYVLDHRGQGESERFLKDPEKSHIEDFSLYTKDLEIFLKQEILSRHPGKKIYLLAHSMGGVISLNFLLKNPKAFPALAITAPMFRIQLPDFLQNSLLKAFPFFHFIFKEHFVLGKRAKKTAFTPNNLSSHSPVRYEFNKFLENKYPVYIRGATLQWIREAIKASKDIRGQAENFSTPLLIISGGKDRVTDIQADENFCLRARECSHIKLDKAKHEILMEEDSLRTEAIEKLLLFFKNH